MTRRSQVRILPAQHMGMPIGPLLVKRRCAGPTNGSPCRNAGASYIYPSCGDDQSHVCAGRGFDPLRLHQGSESVARAGLTSDRLRITLGPTWIRQRRASQGANATNNRRKPVPADAPSGVIAEALGRCSGASCFPTLTRPSERCDERLTIYLVRPWVWPYIWAINEQRHAMKISAAVRWIIAKSKRP